MQARAGAPHVMVFVESSWSHARPFQERLGHAALSCGRACSCRQGETGRMDVGEVLSACASAINAGGDHSPGRGPPGCAIVNRVAGRAAVGAQWASASKQRGRPSTKPRASAARGGRTRAVPERFSTIAHAALGDAGAALTPARRVCVRAWLRVGQQHMPHHSTSYTGNLAARHSACEHGKTACTRWTCATLHGCEWHRDSWDAARWRTCPARRSHVVVVVLRRRARGRASRAGRITHALPAVTRVFVAPSCRAPLPRADASAAAAVRSAPPSRCSRSSSRR